MVKLLECGGDKMGIKRKDLVFAIPFVLLVGLIGALEFSILYRNKEGD